MLNDVDAADSDDEEDRWYRGCRGPEYDDGAEDDCVIVAVLLLVPLLVWLLLANVPGPCSLLA